MALTAVGLGAPRSRGLFTALEEADQEVDVGSSSPPAFVPERGSSEDVPDSSVFLQTGQRDKLDVGAAMASGEFIKCSWVSIRR